MEKIPFPPFAKLNFTPSVISLPITFNSLLRSFIPVTFSPALLSPLLSLSSFSAETSNAGVGVRMQWFLSSSPSFSLFSALTWVLCGPQSLWEYLFWHGAPPPLTLVFSHFLTLFSSSSSTCPEFLLFLKDVFQNVSISLADWHDPVVDPLQLAGTGCVQYKAASGLFSLDTRYSPTWQICSSWGSLWHLTRCTSAGLPVEAAGMILRGDMVHVGSFFAAVEYTRQALILRKFGCLVHVKLTQILSMKKHYFTAMTVLVNVWKMLYILPISQTFHRIVWTPQCS